MSAAVPTQSKSLVNADTDITERPQKITRDVRFQHIIEAQLGKNGLHILNIQSILMVLALIVVVAVVLGSLFSNWHKKPNQQNATLIL